MLNELQRTPLAVQLYQIVPSVWTKLWIAPFPAFTFEGEDTFKTSENKGCEGLLAVLLNIRVFWDVTLRRLLKQRDIP